MVSDELGKKLHDRVTRGEALSAEDRKQLEAWYVAQDRAEMEMLNQSATPETVTSLQAQVDSVLLQLGTVTKRIQEVAKENEMLRKEIATFRRQLAQRVVTQPI